MEDRCLLASGLSAALVADMVPGAVSSTPRQLINANGTLYFYALTTEWPSLALWKSDGTAAGSVRIMNAEPPDATVPDMAAIGGTVFFNANAYLYKTDGTTTAPLKSFYSVANHLTPVNSHVFFTAHGGNGVELWVTDGTTAGTKEVKDIYPGAEKGWYCEFGRCYRSTMPHDSDPQGLTNVNGILFFTAFDGAGRYLWRSDATGGPTKIVKKVGAANLTNVSGTLFFAGTDGTTGQELWKSDGTSAGTVRVRDILPGNGGAAPQHLTNVNGTLYFTANNGTHGRELWKSDGTAAGTVLVKDINPRAASSNLSALTNVNGILYFTVDDGIHGAELWKSDGTAAGTVLVMDIVPGIDGSNPDQLTNVNGLLYFAAHDGTNGRELWQSDGTAAGTLMVQDIYPGSGSSAPAYLVAMNNKLYFSADDGIHGRELWDPPPVGDSGDLVVADWGGDKVLRFDGSTGAFLDTFVAKHSGGLNQPYGVLFGPHDHNLYVSTGEFGGPGQLKAVLRYNGATGTFIDVFTKGGDLQSPQGIIFGPDGNLYVATGTGGLGGRIARFDGKTGAFLGDFVPPLGGGLRGPDGIVFGPSGTNPDKLDLYVSSAITDSVLRYDGRTGAFLAEFVASGSGGLDAPQGLTFGPDGNLYVASFGTSSDSPAVLRFQGPAGETPGAFIDRFVPTRSGGLGTPFGLIFGPDSNGDGKLDLYVTNSDVQGNSLNGKNGTVKRYDGVTGAFIDTFVRARSGGLDDAGFLTFPETDPVTLDYTGASLIAARTAREPVNKALGSDQVQPLLTEAFNRWRRTGANTSGLKMTEVRIVDLPGSNLGQVNGHTIWLDSSAAGWGWFIDATPWDDSEFTTPGDLGERRRMDLLTAIAHEVGHLLGYENSDDGVMDDTLDAGERRMPVAGTSADHTSVEPVIVDSILALDWSGGHHRHRDEVLESSMALFGRSHRIGLGRGSMLRR